MKLTVFPETASLPKIAFDESRLAAVVAHKK
jgi:hypothetical protein